MPHKAKNQNPPSKSEFQRITNPPHTAFNKKRMPPAAPKKLPGRLDSDRVKG